MTDEELKNIAEAAAEAAVQKVLLRLGIDPQDPQEFPERKRDFEYLHRLRVGSEIVKRQGLTSVVSLITTALIGALVAAFYKWRPF